jgi:hypothetical protein
MSKSAENELAQLILDHPERRHEIVEQFDRADKELSMHPEKHEVPGSEDDVFVFIAEPVVVLFVVSPPDRRVQILRVGLTRSGA